MIDFKILTSFNQWAVVGGGSFKLTEDIIFIISMTNFNFFLLTMANFNVTWSQIYCDYLSESIYVKDILKYTNTISY